MEKGAKLVQHVSPMAPGRPTEKLNIYQKKEPVNRFDSRRDELHTARKATEDFDSLREIRVKEKELPGDTNDATSAFDFSLCVFFFCFPLQYPLFGLVKKWHNSTKCFRAEN